MHITNLISRGFGFLAKTQFPSPIQNFLNNTYVKVLGLDMSEFLGPSSYKTLNELFTRSLKHLRKIDMLDDNFISPCDSFVSECGKLNKLTSLQIKGMSYSVEKLLTDLIGDKIKPLENGSFMNFYLSPKDYHRYHSPSSCKINRLIHVPGKLYPVNFTFLKKKLNLFIENERVILECIDDKSRLFYMVFVGALNVGQMCFTFEKKVETNKNTSKITEYTYNNLYVKKGDLLGYFKMGSTIVLLWQKDFIKLKPLANQKVKFGTIVADKN